MRAITILSLFIFAGSCTPSASAQKSLVIEDFEGYEIGGLPSLWRIPDKRSRMMRVLPPDHAKPNDYVRVVMGEGGKVLRAYTRGESVQIALPKGDGLEWDVDRFPRLRWRWRADQLPEGAREDRRSLNDTGAALYVAFECNDWLGRPCTIKYTYSSTLPKGALARYGKLQALVVSSALETKERWVEIERNVVQDYEMFFGRRPPQFPLYIMLWNDSDNTGGAADVYFDYIVALSEE